MGWVELTDYPKMAHNKKCTLVNYKIFNTSTHITNFNPIFFNMVSIQPTDVLFRVLKSTYTNCFRDFRLKHITA